MIDLGVSSLSAAYWSIVDARGAPEINAAQEIVPVILLEEGWHPAFGRRLNWFFSTRIVGGAANTGWFGVFPNINLRVDSFAVVERLVIINESGLALYRASITDSSQAAAASSARVLDTAFGQPSITQGLVIVGFDTATNVPGSPTQLEDVILPTNVPYELPLPRGGVILRLTQSNKANSNYPALFVAPTANTLTFSVHVSGWILPYDS